MFRYPTCEAIEREVDAKSIQPGFSPLLDCISIAAAYIQ